MNQKKARKLRQQLRKELKVEKNQKVSYNSIKHKIEETLKPGEHPRFSIQNVCTGFRGAYLRAKKGV